MDWLPPPNCLVSTINDTNIYGEDVATFLPGRWLTDNAITFALEYIFSGLLESEQNKIHLVHACICEALKLTESDAEAAMFFEGTDLQKKEKVFFVVNDNCDASCALGGSHWSLLLWIRSRQQFFYFDSIPQLREQSLFWVRKIVSRSSRILGLSPTKVASGDSFDVADCPQQTNGSDCGMYLIEVARILMQSDPEELRKEFDGTDIREKRLEWIEILRKTLNSK